MSLSQQPNGLSSQDLNADTLFFEKHRVHPIFVGIFASICIHLLLFMIIGYLLKRMPPPKTATADTEENAPVKVTLNPPQIVSEPKPEISKPQPQPQPQTKPSPQPPQRTLTTERETAPSVITPPPSSVQEEAPPKLSQNMERLLPKSNPEYLQKLRNETTEQTNSKEITGDAGDIPIRGTERRRDMPMIVDRFEHKDLSLFQFSQMFHDKFAAIWNSKERWVPPQSPLRPGDVVYYKIFINPDGTLDHFENLTNKMKPSLNTEHLDSIFEQVISQTLPMQLPAKLEKNVKVTEILAIQVVNKTLFMNFGGQ